MSFDRHRPKRHKKHRTREYIQKGKKYKYFKKTILERDHHQCQFPGCQGDCVTMTIHHIYPWSSFPQLRSNEMNCITICRKCHDIVDEHEDFYRPIFLGLIEEIYHTQTRRSFAIA